MKIRFLSLFFTTCIFFFSSGLYAEDIIFRADSMTGKSNDSNTTTSLLGNAYIKTESMEIYADTIEISGENYRIVTVSGNVSGTSLKNGFTFKCSNMQYDRKTQIAILENDVTMIDTENDVTISAQYIKYNEETQIATMQIAVKIIQKSATSTSSFAIYRKKTQILELAGSPEVIKDDDTYTAQEITLNIDTEEMILDGKVTGTVTDKEEVSTNE